MARVVPSSPEALALGLWALATLPQEEQQEASDALVLIEKLMASGARISVETYEHACQVRERHTFTHTRLSAYLPV